jgi:hypothetical protein
VAEFIKQVADQFVKVIYVPGNHEFYHHDFNQWANILRQEVTKLGVSNTWSPFENVGVTVLDGVRFIVGTLWGEGSTRPEYAALMARGIADFHVINKGQQRLTVDMMMQFSDWHKKEIFRYLNEPFEGKTVVVTHHLPSYELVADRFLGSAINGAFVTECMDLMTGDIVPDLWLHGHTHDQIDKVIERKDFKLRVVVNPAGYRNEWDTKYNEYFVEPKFINI